MYLVKYSMASVDFGKTGTSSPHHWSENPEVNLSPLV